MRDEDVARLSSYMRRHLNVHGHYPFHLTELVGGWWGLRDPDNLDGDRDCRRSAPETIFVQQVRS